ncbi:MAG TPA: M3 family oligoendopeptidase [Chitinophagales bacterium]|nr:M3 family oligoendopeptidase [Chitinophagales bacterium]
MKFSEMNYTRPDLTRVENEFNNLLARFDNAASADEQKQVLSKINELKNEFSTYASIASVRNSIDTTDTFYEAEQEFFDTNEPVIKDLHIKFYKSLGSSKFKNELQKDFGNQLFNLADVSLKTFDTSIIEDLKEENKLGTQYTKLVASAEVEFNGEKLTLPALSAFMESTDRETRKKAYLANQSFFAAHEAEFDDIYDKLVKVRTRIAHKLGCKNFIELAYYRMARTDYNADMVAGFRDDVLKHVVPLASKLRERQRQRTGIDKLKAYDLSHNFNSGNPKPIGTPEEIVANGQKMYSELSQETKEFFDFMVNNDLMDLVNKKGKASGGYCTMFPKYKAPFIFANFNGTVGDVDVLTHEAGHAFQCFESRNFEVEEYYWPTMESCEIHSMSMEHLTYPWMKLFFGADTDKYKFVHLSSNILFLPYGVAVDEFQHIVYANPEMTPAERKQTWLQMEKKYRPWMDYDGIDYLERGGFWQRQGHIYRSPFYYIDYCLAQLCAFQFWSRSQQDFAGAWNDYLRLCKAGGSDSFLGLVKLAGLQSPFNKEVFGPLFTELETYLNSFDDMKM